MMISSFYAGMIFMLIGIVGLNISDIFAISFILSSISFGSGFYHILDKVRKKWW